MTYGFTHEKISPRPSPSCGQDLGLQAEFGTVGQNLAKFGQIWLNLTKFGLIWLNWAEFQRKIQHKMVQFIYSMKFTVYVRLSELNDLSWLSVPDRVTYFKLLHIF